MPDPSYLGGTYNLLDVLEDVADARGAGDDERPPEDDRPELLVAVETAILPWTRPPQVVVRLRTGGGRGTRIFRPRRGVTATEATFAALVVALRDRVEPARVGVGLDDPIAAKLIDRGMRRLPAWLNQVGNLLADEVALGGHDLLVEHLDVLEQAARSMRWPREEEGGLG